MYIYEMHQNYTYDMHAHNNSFSNVVCALSLIDDEECLQNNFESSSANEEDQRKTRPSDHC